MHTSKPYFRFGITLLIAYMGLYSTSGAQENKPEKNTKTVVSEPELKAGAVHRFFFGKGYRILWTTPIELEYLDLVSYGGGLTPTGTGKGMQSLGLRFVGADGRSYSFRPIKKSLAELVPEYFVDTFVEDIIEDQLKSALPTAPPVIPVLLDAVNVLHNVPKLIVIPDDPVLGEYQDQFAGQVGTIEEWPNEGRDNTPGFSGATEIHSTDELEEVLRSDPEQRVDVHNFLTARLVDILIGDWDRHRGQWRWANLGEGTPPSWVPIPEDRDQAFARYDGLLFGIVRQVAPQLTNFGPKYNRILGMTWNGRTVDRRLLTGLSKPEWMKIAAEVQTRINDDVIDNALRQLPAAHFELVAKDIAANLKIRRAKLPMIANKYYRHLAGEVDVHATDTSEVVEAVRLPNGFLELSIFSTEDGEKASSPYYSRRFDPGETKDVRLFIYGGDDKVVITGDGPPKIWLKIICEAGKDEIVDSSLSGGTQVYDSREQGGASVQGASIDHRVYNPPKQKVPGFLYRDWGHMMLARGPVNINSDLGFLIGAGLSYERYGFQRHPFASRWTATLSYATKLKSFRLSAVHERIRPTTPCLFPWRRRTSLAGDHGRCRPVPGSCPGL
jgi:hypothetical protein